MAKNSAGGISVVVGADGTPAINEFARVDGAMRRTFSKMEKEAGRLAEGIGKKFRVADIGKSVLQGFGLGSGFAVAQTITDKIVGVFERQAKEAKDIEDSTGRQLEYTKQIIALRQTDEQRLSTMIAERARIQKEFDTLNSADRRTVMIPNYGRRGNELAPKPVILALTAEESAASKTKAEDLSRMGKAIDEITIAAARAKSAAQVLRETDALFQSLDETSTQTTAGAERLKKSYDELGSEVSLYVKGSLSPMIEMEQAARRLNEEKEAELESIAEKYRLIADPLRAYRLELVELDKIKSRISSGEYAASSKQIRGKMVDTALEDFFGDMDKQSKLYDTTNKLTEGAREMGWAFGSAFEEAALGAGKLGDIFDGLVKDIARMALRMGIINPIMNSAFGLTGTSALATLWGGARAGGGPVDGGTTYMVGEKGPELFTPSGGGTITPNHKLSGGRGDSFNFSYNIGSGVTAQQLGPILAMHKRDLLGTIADAKRRRMPASA